MGILESLLGGGGSDPYDIYGDLFTDKQKAAMREQQQGQGLLRMAAALGQAAMPSRMPVPIGAVLGQAAGALGTGQDAQMEQMLKAAQTAELVRQAQSTRAMQQKFLPLYEDALRRIRGQGGGGAPTAPAAPAAPGPGGGPAAAALAIPAAPDADLMGGYSGAPASGGSGDFPTGAPPARSKSASLGDPAAGLLAAYGGPPDQLVGQGQGILSPATLAAFYGGGQRDTPPFSLASLGGSGSGSPGTDEPPTPEELRKLGLIVQYESGNRNIMQQAVGPRGGYNPSVGRVTGPSSAGGYYQMIDPTYRHAAALAGIDTQLYQRAIDAPRELQDKAALALLREQGTSPWDNYNAPLAAALGGRTGGRFAGMGPVRGGGGGAPDTVLPSGDNPDLAALTALSGLFSGGGSGGLPDLASLIKLTSGPGGLSLPPSSVGGGPVPDAASAGGETGSDVTEINRALRAGEITMDEALSRAAAAGRPAGTNPALAAARTAAAAPPPPPAFQQGLSPEVYRQRYGQAYPPGALEGGLLAGSGGGAAPAPAAAVPAPAAAAAAPAPTPAAPAAIPGVGRIPTLGPIPTLSSGPGAGVVPGLGIKPEELAILNAMAEMAKLGTPFKSLLETYYKSPEYLQQAAGAGAAGTLSFDLYKQQSQSLLAIKQDMAKDNMTFDDKGNVVLLPEAQRIRTMNSDQIAAAQEKWKAVFNIHDRTVYGPDMQPVTQPMTDYEFAQRQQSVAERARMGAPPRPGDIASTPVLNPGQSKSQELGVAAGWKALEETHAREIDANRRLQSYGQIAEAMQGFQTGATAETRLYYKGILRDLGVIEGADVPDGEVAQRAMRRLQLDAAGVTKGSTSDYERGLIAQGSTQLSNTPEAVVKTIDQLRRLDEYDKKIAQIHRDVADKNSGVPNIIEAQRRIAALGPPLSPGEVKALEKFREGQVPSSANRTEPPAGGFKEGHILNYPDGSQRQLKGNEWVVTKPPRS